MKVQKFIVDIDCQISKVISSYMYIIGVFNCQISKWKPRKVAGVPNSRILKWMSI